MADLQDAIAELRRVSPEGGWTAAKITAEHPDPMVLADYVAATLNAVLSGDLILRADAELAVAEAIRRAAEYIAQNSLSWRFSSPWHGKDFQKELLALVPADALAEVQRLRKTYEELYQDAIADAKSDAQDFDSDLWKMVRAYLDELNLDWRDYSDDGITADEALTHIRECMNEETRRAEKAEADRDAALARVVEKAARDARDVFSDHKRAKEAVDYMEQLIYAAIRALAPADGLAVAKQREAELVGALATALRKHHEWHLSQDGDGAAWGIDPVDAYSESGLCEETVAALALVPADALAEVQRLREAVEALVVVLDRNDKKGPIPDVEMMFCWLAAQGVRAAFRKIAQKGEAT